MTATAVIRGSEWDRIAFAKSILHAEAAALATVAERLGPEFLEVIDTLFRCSGRVVLCGVGKSADIGQKIVGTLNSTGTRAFTLDATRAAHGDLGMIAPDDVIVLLSHSGESEELLRLLPSLADVAAKRIAITGRAESRLAAGVELALVYGPIAEACPNSLAPSSSTTVMVALGDAIAFTLSELRNFRATDFARFHPAGSLGRKLATVEHAMRFGDDLRLALASQSVREVFANRPNHHRRTGAIMLTHPSGELAGLFTDSDLARLFEREDTNVFQLPIADVMTRAPITTRREVRLTEAIELMRRCKISELPVVDDGNCPIGMLDITDLIGAESSRNSTAARQSLRLYGPPAG